MKGDLTNLIEAAKKLFDYSKKHNGLNEYFSYLFRLSGGDTVRLAEMIGSNKSQNKIPALGIAIAAEALKNLGYDVAKPDRHINRALGSFSLFTFCKWEDREGRKSPKANEKELLGVMYRLKEMASVINERVALIDNAIWLLCAKSGAYLENIELQLIGQRSV